MMDKLAHHQKVFPNHQWAYNHTFRHGQQPQKVDCDFLVHLLTSTLALAPAPYTPSQRLQCYRMHLLCPLTHTPSCPPVPVKSLWGEKCCLHQKANGQKTHTKKTKKHLGMGFLDDATKRDNDSFSVYLLTFIEQHIVYFSWSL